MMVSYIVLGVILGWIIFGVFVATGVILTLVQERLEERRARQKRDALIQRLDNYGGK